MRALLLVAATACGGSSGVDIEIKVDSSISTVEVFVAHEHCGDCPGGVAWLDNQPRPPGKTLLTRSDLPIETRIAPIQLDDGPFIIHLEALPDYADTIALAIVGFDGNGDARALGFYKDLRIPTSSAEHWTVTLDPVDPARLTFDDPPGPEDHPIRAAAWGREGNADEVAGSRCLAIQHWDGASEWKGTFIVPESDQDCDGEPPDTECDEHNFNLNQFRLGEPVTCVLPVPTANIPAMPCVVGQSACTDGDTDPSPACAETRPGTTERTCVPDAVCEECSAPFGLETCVAALSRRVDTISHVTCVLNGDSADGETCGQGGPGYSVKLELPVPCSSLSLRPITEPFGVGQSLNANPMFAIGDATIGFYAETATPSCKVHLYFASGTASLGTSHWYMLAVHAGYDGATLLVPLRIDLEGTDCSVPATVDEICTVSDTLASKRDHIVSCAGIAPMMP